MNKFLICIVGFLALTILSGCISAREAQNPQPKAEILCEEWGNNLKIPAKKMIQTPQQMAQEFIDACTVGNYDSMPRLESYYQRKHCKTLANATIKEIDVLPHNEKVWQVSVMCPVDSKQRNFYMEKIKVNYNGKVVTEWKISFPMDFR